VNGRCAVLLATVLAALPAQAEIPAPVQAALDKAGVPAASVALVAEPLEGPGPRFAHNADAAMNPASVMKLVTAYAALDLLGPAFTFHTDVLATGELAGGILEGDLYIRGGGDPKLTYERVWQMARQLRARGLREIHGDIVVDRSYFSGAPHDPGKFDNEGRRAYNAGADALLVNYNAIAFRFIPEGDTVRVVGEPDLPNVEVTSRLRATREPCFSYRSGLQYEVGEMGLLANVSFSGTYPAACGERTLSLSVFEPAKFAESHLRWLWSEVGGVLRGTVRAGSVPEKARLLLRQDSEPLPNLVRDMNKHSNNVMARHLFLALSAEPAGRGGEAQASARRVLEWLRSRHVEPQGLVMENGSGLSRVERASAATLAALLRSAYASAVMPEIMSSLPLYAIDGTLRTRKAGGVAGQAHLKGGTLNDVQAIAGYVRDRDGRRWVVAMLINHPRANAAQGALDAFVDWTYESAAREARAAR
jgi:D-alanyl-D-alanine carboxypeptidase/D-alanyl-D-alanine-endopeptidase (penicillin-binding protein 4)